MKPFVLVVSRGVPSPSAPLLGQFELDQAKALRDAGCTVVVAAMDVRSVRRRRRLGLSSLEVEGIPVEVASVPLGAPPAPLLLAAMKPIWKRLYRRVVERHGVPDVVHAHFHQWGAPVVEATPEPRPLVVVTEHSSKLTADPVPRDADHLARVACRADRVVAVSHPLAEVIRRRYDVTATVIGDVIDTTVFSPEPRVAHQGIRLMSCGNLIARKRFDLLVEAFHRAFLGWDDVSLDIVGDGPERTRLQARIDELDLGQRVRLLGRLDRPAIADLYRASDGFALLSEHETFGVVWAEAMAAGLPVVASRSQGPEDFVTDDVGLFAREGVEGAAAALRTLVLRLDQYDRDVVSAHIGVRFAPEAVAAQLLALYREGLAARGADAPTPEPGDGDADPGELGAES